MSCSAIRLRSEGAGQISTGEEHHELTYLALASATMANAVLDTETYTARAPGLISATTDRTLTAAIQHIYLPSSGQGKAPQDCSEGALVGGWVN